MNDSEKQLTVVKPRNTWDILTIRDLWEYRDMLLYLVLRDDIKNIKSDIFMKKNPKERTYNVCTGKTVDLLTLAKIIKEIDGRDKPIEIKDQGLKQEYSGDNSLLMMEFKEIKFTPTKKAASSIPRTVVRFVGINGSWNER